MINHDKLIQAIVNAGTESKRLRSVARELRRIGNSWKADMTAMDADFAEDERNRLAGKLLNILSRKAEIEAFEHRRNVQIDVMFYNVPSDESIDQWWDFINDDTAVVTNPNWLKSS